jgi:hypothetical protein
MSARDCAQHIVDARPLQRRVSRDYAARAAALMRTHCDSGGQHDAVEPYLNLYDRFVKQTIDELKEAPRRARGSVTQWKEIHNEFATRISGSARSGVYQDLLQLDQPPVPAPWGVAPDIEFVATDLCDPLLNTRSTVGTNNYVNHGSLSLLFEDLLGDALSLGLA